MEYQASTILQKLNYTAHIIVVNHILTILRDKSSDLILCRGLRKGLQQTRKFVSQRHRRPFFLSVKII